VPYNKLLTINCFIFFTSVIAVDLETPFLYVFDNSFQNSSAACRDPYYALAVKYSMGLPILFYLIYFLFILGSRFAIISAISPSKSICVVSYLTACRKDLGMSVTAMYVPSLASITHDNIIAFSKTVGELASSLLMGSNCSLPLSKPLDLIVPSCFSFWTCDILVYVSYTCMTFHPSSSAKVLVVCVIVLVHSTLCHSFLANFVRASFTFICVRMTCGCVIVCIIWCCSAILDCVLVWVMILVSFFLWDGA